MPSVDAAAFWYSGWSNTHGQTSGYFFASPSGKWECGIVEHLAFQGPNGAVSVDGPSVGCEAATGRQLPVKGAPLVPATDGSGHDLTQASSIILTTDSGPQFVKTGQPYLRRPEPTPALGYNRNLTARGYTCNTQTTGVSCRNDLTGSGFTFSTDGYTFEYTPVAEATAGAPAAGPSPAGVEVVLGGPTDQYSVGFGTARPNGISTNSLCGNTINDISWDSWGGPVARGSGTLCQSSGAASRGEPRQQVSLTASDIGDCQGKQAYRKLQWDSGAPQPIC